MDNQTDQQRKFTYTTFIWGLLRLTQIKVTQKVREICLIIIKMARNYTNAI